MFKNLMLPWLLPIFGLFFAAGADALAGVDIGEINAGDIGGVGDESSTGGEDGHETDTGDAGGESTTSPREGSRQTQTQEDPEFQEFKGQVSARLRGWTKQSPKLAEAFKEQPAIQEKFEATLRRDVAYREIWPSIAEARQMRERFPGGLADVKALESELQDVQQLDKDFGGKDADGKYPGHATIIDGMFRDNRAAALSFFRTIPKEWARLDPESWNDFGVGLLASTFQRSDITGFVGDLVEAAKEAKQPGIEKGLGQLLNWVQGYLKGKPEPTEAERRVAQDRANLDRDRANSDKEAGQRFNASFVQQSKKLQSDIIKAHPAVQRFLGSRAIPEAKKMEVVEQIRKSAEQFAGRAPSFMGKLKPAYSARNIEEALAIQKTWWSQQWFLNRFVRTILNKETPQLVRTNQESIRRRAGAPSTKTPANASDKTKQQPTGPKQIGTRWYRDGGKGAPYTPEEVLRGLHLK